ncbi:MAG: hypothetical protein COB20_06795 [SAR86 cluster bacterium]|uniref:DUF6531 domain-containing protein n=1 Tax=SAR86 cluster bacterium TaxID=2030880 RepID=A0A2A4X6T4_9GAMM|nr:MAG: hypothetical protein COB20_06795 [SAR86 cluster bacterium]
MRMIIGFLLLLTSVTSVAQSEYYWVYIVGNSVVEEGPSPSEVCGKTKAHGQAGLESFYPDEDPVLGGYTIITNSPHDPPSNYTCVFSGSGLPWEPEVYFAPNIALRGAGCSGEYEGGVCTDKDKGPPGCDKCPKSKGNPINGLTGYKYQREDFFTSAGSFPLSITAHYNSTRFTTTLNVFDGEWSWNYTQYLSFNPFETEKYIMLFREDGVEVRFKETATAGEWVADANVIFQLEETFGLDANGMPTLTAYIVTTPTDLVEEYSDGGRLLKISNRDGLSQMLSYVDDTITVTDDFGNSISLIYDDNPFSVVVEKKLVAAIDTDGHEYKFQHSYRDFLEFVSFPDTTANVPGSNPFGEDNPFRQYHYESNLLDPLTGITDENGDRFATWNYAGGGFAVSSEHAGGVGRVDLNYTKIETGVLEVTDIGPLGKELKTTFIEILDERLITQIERAASATSPAATRTFTYDVNGYPASQSDWNGNLTNFVHDSRGLELSRTEGVGTAAERTLSTTWHPIFRKPTEVVEPGRTTSFAYDSLGHMLTRMETDTTAQSVPYTTTGRTRTTTFTYLPEGVNGEFQVATINGPRTDVNDMTTFTYTAEGYIASVSNPLGHTTQVTNYNSRGLPLSTIDSNNVVTNMSYHPRGWLLSTTVVDPSPSGNDATTVNEYDNVGQLTKVTLANGAFLSYEYDAAHRLVAISNNLGEKQEFTLDVADNLILENSRDSGGSITRTQARVYDDLSRMIQAIGGANQLTEMVYDDNGNNTAASLDPLGINQSTLQAFDALDRLATVTDAISNDSGFAYDARDNLISVTDQRGLTTNYVYDGLNNLIQQSSPDTGITVYTYDDAGNQLSQTDARGVATNNTYDALNRLTSVSYPTSSGENIAYIYDQLAAGFGVGRLTQLTDQTGATSYVYDYRGNQVESAVTIQSNNYATQYAYDLADNLVQTTYPSGRIVSHQLDSLGRTEAITTLQNSGAQLQNIASNVGYLPFGPMTELDYGNNLALSIDNDQDYRVTGITIDDIGASNPDILGLTYTQNAVDNITAIADSVDVNESQTFIYDLLNRLQGADGDYGDQSYSYDPVGNRLSLTTVEGGITTVETYTYDTSSNRLLSVDEDGVLRTLQYDTNGNIISDDRGAETGFTLEYNDQNRLIDAIPAGVQP